MATKAPTATPAQSFQTAPQTAASPGGGMALAPLPAAGTGALALPPELAAEMAAYAKDQAAGERPSVSKLSLRGGLLSHQGSPISGNILPCIILGAIYRNTYYDKPFDPNNLANPVCFALSEDGDDMEAHENVPDENMPGDDPEKPRASARGCTGCKMNAWGSDPKQNSRGKACKETRRLVVLAANNLNTAEEAQSAELAILDIPVTSGKNYSNFVNGLAAAASVPPWITVTNVSTERDPKTQFKVVFTPINIVADPAIIAVLKRRRDEAVKLAMTPYDEVSSTNDGTMTPLAMGKQKF